MKYVILFILLLMPVAANAQALLDAPKPVKKSKPYKFKCLNESPSLIDACIHANGPILYTCKSDRSNKIAFWPGNNCEDVLHEDDAPTERLSAKNEFSYVYLQTFSYDGGQGAVYLNNIYGKKCANRFKRVRKDYTEKRHNFEFIRQVNQQGNAIGSKGFPWDSRLNWVDSVYRPELRGVLSYCSASKVDTHAANIEYAIASGNVQEFTKYRDAYLKFKRTYYTPGKHEDKWLRLEKLLLTYQPL